MDTGGPRREFFRLFVKGTSEKYLHGKSGKLTFASSTVACQVSIDCAYINFCFTWLC